MKFTLLISKTVQKQIDDLPNDVRERVIEEIQCLADEPRPDGVVKLKGLLYTLSHPRSLAI